MGFLEGKTAIITGAGFAALKDGSAGSIGYGIATAYAKEGANLVITGRNVKKLETAKEKLEAEYGIQVLCVAADVNAGADNQAVVQNVIDQAIEKFSRIDVLVNNAQASASGVTLADHTTDQFDLAIYSGLYATFYYMQACYPYLKETKGSVINFASGAGLFGNFGQCAYAAAKEGIRGMTPRGRHRMGPRRHQRERGVPAGLDGRSGELPGSLSRRLHGQRAHAPHGPLRQCGDRDRSRRGAACQSRLQVHERRDPDPGRRHGPAPVILLAFHKHMF